MSLYCSARVRFVLTEGRRNTTRRILLGSEGGLLGLSPQKPFLITESAPGHLLLSATLTELGEPIRSGDVLTMTATVPPHDKIRRSQKGKGQPIVPIEIKARNQSGELVLRGQVVKLME